MKTSKKILGVALVFIMIFNVFAVGTFAAGTESAVDLYLSADKAVYAPGDTIVLTFSAQAIPAVGELLIGGMYAIGYNSAAIQPYSSNADALSDTDKAVAHGFVAKQEGYDDTISSLADTSMTTVDQANGWDSVIIYNVCDDAATSFDATSKTELFTLNMKVASNAKSGTYVIGFNKESFIDGNAYTNAAAGPIFGYTDDYGYGTAVNYGFNNVTITVGNGGSTSQTATVANKDVQTQWSDKANGILKLGFRGTIANYDHTTDLVTGSTTKLAKLAEVGVVFSKTDSTPTRAEIGSTCTDAPAYAIYSFTTGEYYFRAVVDNVPATGEGSTATIYANAYIKYNGQYYEATNAVLQTTGATQYADKDMANKD